MGEHTLHAAMFGSSPILLRLIARVGGTPAGVILAFETYGTFAASKRLFIEDLFVRAEHRGHGLGRALIAPLGRICPVREYDGLRWRVLESNESGIRFYRAIGASISTEHRNCSLEGHALRASIGGAGGGTLSVR